MPSKTEAKMPWPLWAQITYRPCSLHSSEYTVTREPMVTLLPTRKSSPRRSNFLGSKTNGVSRVFLKARIAFGKDAAHDSDSISRCLTYPAENTSSSTRQTMPSANSADASPRSWNWSAQVSAANRDRQCKNSWIWFYRSLKADK